MALDRIRRLSLAARPPQRLILWFDNFRLAAGTEGTSTATPSHLKTPQPAWKAVGVTILQVESETRFRRVLLSNPT